MMVFGQFGFSKWFICHFRTNKIATIPSEIIICVISPKDNAAII